MAKKKLILIIVPVLLILIGAGVFFSGILGEKKAEAGKDEHASTEKTKETDEEADDGHDAKAEPIFYTLPDLIVNIKGKNKAKATGMLKIKINLELGNAESTALVEKRLPRIVDQLQTYLRELRVEDLEGSEGLNRLKEELLIRITTAAGPASIKDVLFAEIIMQ